MIIQKKRQWFWGDAALRWFGGPPVPVWVSARQFFMGWRTWDWPELKHSQVGQSSKALLIYNGQVTPTTDYLHRLAKKKKKKKDQQDLDLSKKKKVLIVSISYTADDEKKIIAQFECRKHIHIKWKYTMNRWRKSEYCETSSFDQYIKMDP